MNTLFIFGAKYLILFPLIIVCIFFLRLQKEKRMNVAIFGIVAAALALGASRLASLLYFNPRPFVSEHVTPLISHAADNGFPSDHALLAAVLASIVMFYDKRVGAALWVLALLVGVSRVYVGVHHPIDIFGSIAIAFVMTLIGRIATHRFQKT